MGFEIKQGEETHSPEQFGEWLKEYGKPKK